MIDATHQIAPSSTLCICVEYPIGPGRSVAVVQNASGFFEAARIETNQRGARTAFRIVGEKCRFDRLVDAQQFAAKVSEAIA